MSIFDIFKEISSERNDRNQGPVEWLLVGLGNPGDKYHNTRHNTGFLMMDYVSQKSGIAVGKIKFKALVGEGSIQGHRVMLMKPQTMMNASGLAVKEAAAFYKIPPEHILVFSDDISLDVGRVRLRKSGSDGGQKGLRSIIRELNSDEFPRMRFGVGAKPHPDYDLAAWVLSEFGKEEQVKLFSCFERGYEGVLSVLEGKMDAAVQITNRKAEQ